MAEVSEIVKNVLEQIKNMAGTETVVGQPVKAGESTIIPVTKVSFGFGAGGGDNSAKEAPSGGSATGGGAVIEPIAFIVVGPDGKAQVMPVTEKDVNLSKIIDIVPDILKRFIEKDEKVKKFDQRD
ncbi:MAG: GerW family sporulation protein [Fibrobacterota bacterium]